MYSPIVLFVYNRINHIKATVEALLKNELANKSDMIIYSDGPKNDEELCKITEIRSYLKKIKGFKNLVLVEQERNLGLSKSIIGGITEVMQSYDRAIILEDDIITSPHFLWNFNQALDFFEEKEEIINISGYTFPHESELPQSFFLFFPAVWGWATWKRGWKLFEESGEQLLNKLKNKQLISKFNFDNLLPFSIMLEDQIMGRNDSWAVRWYGTAVLNNKYTLMFNEAQSRNIGHDNSGIHCSDSSAFNVPLGNSKINIRSTTIELKDDVLNELRKYLVRVLYEQHLDLHKVCSDRLELIEKLNKTAEDRLAIINQLSIIIDNLKKENTNLISMLGKSK